MDHPDTSQTFQWTPSSVPGLWKVTIDNESITARYGLGKYEVPLDQLRYVYASASTSALDDLGEKLAPLGGTERARKALKTRQADIVLCYFDEKKSKLRNFSLVFDIGDEQAVSFIDAVLQLRPDTDIRHMDRKEAYELMEALDIRRYLIPIIVGGVVTIMGLAWWFSQ